MRFLFLNILIFFLHGSIAFANKEAANEALEAKNYSVAIKELTSLVEKDDVWAMDKLADVYANKKTEFFDMEKSFNWRKKAADGGRTSANYKLAYYYLTGQGTSLNNELAKEQLTIAAENNIMNAYELLVQLALAETPKDYKSARKWLGRYTEKSGPGNLQTTFGEVNEAQLHLIHAALALDGLGGEVDVDLAYKYFNEYAVMGVPTAQHAVSTIMFNPEFPDYYDPYDSLAWAIILEANGVKGAKKIVDERLSTLSDNEIELGLKKFITYYIQSAKSDKANKKHQKEKPNFTFYVSQRIKEPENARKWFEQAAEKNIPHSNYLLGLIYMDGRNFAANISKAKPYFEQALKNGNNKAAKWLMKIKNYNPDISDPFEKFKYETTIFGTAQIEYKNVDVKISKALATYHLKDSKHQGNIKRAMQHLKFAAYSADKDAQEKMVELYVNNGEDPGLMPRDEIVTWAHMQQINAGKKSSKIVTDFLNTVSEEEKKKSIDEIREIVKKNKDSKRYNGPIKWLGDAEKWLEDKEFSQIS